VGAHHDQLGLFGQRGAHDFLDRRTHPPVAAERDGVVRQEGLDRLDHLLRFLAVVAGHDVGADHAGDAMRNRRLHVQHDQFIVGARQALVGDQEGQRLLGVGAAVGSEQDFHSTMSRSTKGLSA
jgi:hypothetical protein